MISLQKTASPELAGQSPSFNDFCIHTYDCLKHKMQRLALLIQQSFPLTNLILATKYIKKMISDSFFYIIHFVHEGIEWIINIPKGSSHLILGSVKSKETKSKPLVLSELSQKFINDIFDTFEKESFGQSDRISDEIKSLGLDPAFWQNWASQLSIPYEMHENPKNKIINLLSYFKINPKNRKATILKNINSIQIALKIYPVAAYLISPINGSRRFNFFCRLHDGTYCTYHDIDPDAPFSKPFQNANEIVCDDTFTALRLE